MLAIPYHINHDLCDCGKPVIYCKEKAWLGKTSHMTMCNVC